MQIRTGLISLSISLSVFGQAKTVPNMIRNGGFEQVSVLHPEGWTLTQHGNECSLGVAPGASGKYAARLSCTKFNQGWVILAQDGVVKVKKGQWYRLSCQCRGESLLGGAAVALYNRKPWVKCGLTERIPVGKTWAPYETYFRATRDATDTRFEFYFSATGTLYLDDVSLVPTGPPPLKGTLPTKPSGNLLVNGSFELGGYLWGTEGRDSLSATPMKGGPVGNTCLKITVVPEKANVYAVDWFEPRFWKVYGNRIGTAVWAGVEAGKLVTLSAYLRSGRQPVKARLTVGEVVRSVATRVFDVGPEWQRYEIAGVPKETGCFVQIGIEIGDDPSFAELYVDGVQLEQGDRANPFSPRQDIELALSADHYGNIFMTDETPAVELAAYSVRAAEFTVGVKVTDCWDRPVRERTLCVKCSGGTTARKSVRLGSLKKGFFRVTASVAGRPEVIPAKLRLAKVEPLHETFAGKDGPFGINHASPPDSRLKLMRVAGITWVRDWTLKWHQVQKSEGGPFDFEMGDRMINRVLKAGMHVLCVLPHPATPWCTTAPSGPPRTGTARALRRTLSYMPSDVEKFGAYVGACVSHFKDRVKVWEILNEPGHMKPEDYAKLLSVAYEHAKAADPDCRVIGGCSAGPANKLSWYRTLFEHDGLRHMDIVNLHPYPGCSPGRAYEQKLIAFNQCMDCIGRRLPIWNTEYLYCSDDDPLPTVTPRNKPAGSCPDELTAANAMVQYNIVFLCQGTEKLFQHTNHWPLRLTRDALLFSMFFDYGATPKKAFAAHNAMAWLLGLKPRFIRTLDLGPERFCGLFKTDRKTLTVLWRERGADDFSIITPSETVAYDMMGNRIDGRRVVVTNSPTYLVSRQTPSRMDLFSGLEF